MLFAIAIIVVASLLGAAMVRMLRVEQVGVARDVLSTRALLAADSAVQVALYRRFSSLTACATINGSAVDFAGIDGLGSCSATISCTAYTTPATANAYFSLRATGTCGPAGEAASRQVEVLAREI